MSRDNVEDGVAWYADDFSPSIASVRLRALVPMRELGALGIDALRYERSRGPAAYRAIVFLKVRSAAGLKLAMQAKARGVRIVYDLCDNLHVKPAGRRQRRRLQVVDAFLRLADAVVLSSATLREQMMLHHPQLDGRSHVIPDALEPLEHMPGRHDWIGNWHLRRLNHFLARHSGALHCVWFGVTKADRRLPGTGQLAAAARHLEIFAAQRPVTLTVISNRRMLYRSVSADWRIPHHFVPWSLATFPAALKAHDVAVIPVQVDEFTRGKTVNRPATAIAAGLGVVADAIESYEELRPFIFLDDWQAGLTHYSRTAPRSDPLVADARRHLQERYADRQIALLWRAVLAGAAP